MATSNSFTITAGVTSFACDFGATDKETIVLTISSTGAVISSNDYSVLGVAASATAGDITIELDDAGDYVGEDLKITKYTNINTGAPADSMLVNFTSSGTTNPTNIQNEFAHLYDIVGQITGGTAVGTVDLGTVSDNLANVDALADIMFASPTQSGGHWDGSDTLSIGGDTTVEGILTTHETRLDDAETLLGFDTGGQLADDVVGSVITLNTNVAALLIAAGFSNPLTIAGSAVTLTDSGDYFATNNVEAALQDLGAHLDLLGQLSYAAGAITVNAAVMNKDAAENWDFIPGTGTDADAATSTGGLRLLTAGSMYYYSGTDSGDGLRVYRAHATTPVVQFLVDCGDSELSFYDASGDVRFYVNASAGGYAQVYNSFNQIGVRLAADSYQGVVFYDGGSQKAYAASDASGYLTIGRVGGNMNVKFYPTYIDFKQSGMEHLKIPANAGAPTTGVAEGSVYYDTGTNKLRVYNGGWVDLH